jgi:hypothetical protein
LSNDLWSVIVKALNLDFDIEEIIGLLIRISVAFSALIFLLAFLQRKCNNNLSTNIDQYLFLASQDI